jgi:hypothetical protein
LKRGCHRKIGGRSAKTFLKGNSKRRLQCRKKEKMDFFCTTESKRVKTRTRVEGARVRSRRVHSVPFLSILPDSARSRPGRFPLGINEQGLWTDWGKNPRTRDYLSQRARALPSELSHACRARASCLRLTLFPSPVRVRCIYYQLFLSSLGVPAECDEGGADKILL